MKGKVAVRFVELLVEIPEFSFFSLSLCVLGSHSRNSINVT